MDQLHSLAQVRIHTHNVCVYAICEMHRTFQNSQLVPLNLSQDSSQSAMSFKAKKGQARESFGGGWRSEGCNKWSDWLSGSELDILEKAKNKTQRKRKKKRK